MEKSREYGYSNSIDGYTLMILKKVKEHTYFDCSTSNITMGHLDRDLATMRVMEPPTEESIGKAMLCAHTCGYQVLLVVEYRGTLVPRESYEMVYTSEVTLKP